MTTDNTRKSRDGIDVNPELLTWARETAGMSLPAAADALGFRDNKARTGIERLQALERGNEAPTRSVLKRMAAKYRRPILVFYLDKVPPEAPRGKDFRTVGSVPAQANPLLDALLRDFIVRQSIVKSLLEDDDDGIESHKFVGSTQLADDPQHVATDIAEAIDFDLGKFRQKNSPETAFKYLRQKIEAVGVFLNLEGDLGSRHTSVDVETFRGFAIADPIAPFIVVNSQDAANARSFTALHELAHIWLGETGVSNRSNQAKVEKFCNEVAGNILLPSDDSLHRLSNVAKNHGFEAVEHINEFAKQCNVSPQSVAYRLFKVRSISRSVWETLNNHLEEAWKTSREVQKQTQRSKPGGPSFYTVRRHRLGSALLSVVWRSLNEELITPTKAAKVLGVKPLTVWPLLRKIQQDA